MQRLLFFGLGIMSTLAVTLASPGGQEPGPADVIAQSGSYRVHSEFADVGTLREGARVALAGVTIGEVSRITLDLESYRATVTMTIRNEVDNIAVDSTAVIMTAGLLGDHYIEISPGGHPDSVSDNDYIEDTQSAINIEKLMIRRLTGG